MDLHGRTEPPRAAGEPASLTGFLDYQRQTLEWKCSGLTTEQLRQRAVPPSGMSLLGLVRHMADVECGWFQGAMAGEYSLRYVLLHMIEEYARHNGHADLLRERIDGATGE